MLYLGFNAFLHFKASSWFQRFPHLNAFLPLKPTSMPYLGFNAFLHSKASSWFERFPSLRCFPSLRRRGHIERDQVFFDLSPSSSLQCFILVSTLFVKSAFLKLTSMLYLGSNAFLHFKAPSWFQRFPSLQCFPSLRRRGHIECDQAFLICLPQAHFNVLSSFQRFSPLQSSILVSTLSFTSMLSFTSTQRSHRV